MASSEAAKEGVYLKRLLEGLDMHQGDAVAVSGDNQAAIALAYNPENHDKVKHVERRHFFIREKVEDGLLSVPYVRTVDNIADFFTKALPKETFFSMRDQIMNCDAHSSKEQRACVARGARFQTRAAHGYAIEASLGERIYTGLFKSSYVGRGKTSRSAAFIAAFSHYSFPDILFESARGPILGHPHFCLISNGGCEPIAQKDHPRASMEELERD